MDIDERISSCRERESIKNVHNANIKYTIEYFMRKSIQNKGFASHLFCISVKMYMVFLAMFYWILLMVYC